MLHCTNYLSSQFVTVHSFFATKQLAQLIPNPVAAHFLLANQKNNLCQSGKSEQRKQFVSIIPGWSAKNQKKDLELELPQENERERKEMLDVTCEQSTMDLVGSNDASNATGRPPDISGDSDVFFYLHQKSQCPYRQLR